MTLNPNQARFVAEYIIDLNATQAAIRAGYSERTAKSQGQRLLTNADIQAAVADALEARGKRTMVTQDRVLLEVSRLAFADIRKVVRWGVKEVAVGYDDEGRKLDPADIGQAVVVHYLQQPFVEPINSDDLDADTAATVAEVSMTKDGIKIKLHDKGGAITLAGRHLGMWKDRIELSAEEGVVDAFLAAERRRASA